jgi:hypothetical protein
MIVVPPAEGTVPPSFFCGSTLLAPAVATDPNGERNCVFTATPTEAIVPARAF